MTRGSRVGLDSIIHRLIGGNAQLRVCNKKAWTMGPQNNSFLFFFFSLSRLHLHGGLGFWSRTCRSILSGCHSQKALTLFSALATIWHHSRHTYIHIPYELFQHQAGSMQQKRMNRILYPAAVEILRRVQRRGGWLVIQTSQPFAAQRRLR